MIEGLARLTHTERLQLMKFVCSAVWSDLEVNAPEQRLVLSLALHLGLPEEEIRQVQRWIQVPPPPEEVDPNLVPSRHRALFLQAVEEAMKADAEVDPPEAESLRILRELLTPA